MDGWNNAAAKPRDDVQWTSAQSFHFDASFNMNTTASPDDTFTLAGRVYRSRLLVGTGKYRDMDETRAAIEASGAEIVTVAVRRTNIGQNADEPNILEVLPPDRYTILPNTAGCYDVKTAVRTCRLAREMLDGHKLVKLEVLGDEKTLFPDTLATLQAAEELIRDDFDVMVYTNDDPIMAKRLEDLGCVAVMPSPEPMGAANGITATQPSSSRRLAMIGSSLV